MLNRLFIALSFTILFFIHLPVYALSVSTLQTNQPQINQDTLTDILQQEDYYIKQKRLIKFIKFYVQASQPDKLTAMQDTIKVFFEKYNLSDKEAFVDFMSSIALYKQHNLRNAAAYMSRAVQRAANNEEPYLLFQFYSHLGFIQTDQGNFIGAIYNYRLATKEVAKLKDKIKNNRPQAALNINISDLYYKSGFYAESINYLDKALALLVNDELNKAQLLSVVYYNKSENYFRMNNIDSLIAYHKKLNDPNIKNYKIFTYRQRIGYYLTLLKHDYIKAINQIKLLKQNKNYVPSELEDQHLADAYYRSGQLDSAKYIIEKLLNVSTANHTEIKHHLYDLLAQIAQKKGDDKLASYNFRLALKESQENNARLSQVGNISSQMKIDERENTYNQKTDYFKKQRLWLIFAVIIAALIIAAIALIYRNVKQKRHYETLLYAAKKEELAFINSHEVRKHLTNILGIIDILLHSENKLEDYKQTEPYLLESAAKLDEAIKNISEKLNE
ncbi:tetratricopeptide repeat protein [Mucilaginibacter sp.]|jgi:hypothetical protein|uniref:tetratricopeptide repeat protein n=1 Tax=Mucilaginibacter sp. TaxID=1882438 RepID=UPI00356711E4